MRWICSFHHRLFHKSWRGSYMKLIFFLNNIKIKQTKNLLEMVRSFHENLVCLIWWQSLLLLKVWLKDSYLLSCLDDTLYWRQRSNQLRLKRMFLTPQKGIMNGWVSSSVSIPNGGIFLHPKLSSMYLEIGKKFWFCHVSDLFLTHNDFSFL